MLSGNDETPFEKIKEYTLSRLQKISELLSDEIGLDHLVILKILQIEIHKVKEKELFSSDNFVANLENLAAFIQSARKGMTALAHNNSACKKLDEHLRILQLHIQNYNFYQSLGINYFAAPLVQSPKFDYGQYTGNDTSFARPDYLDDKRIDEIDAFSIVYVSAPQPNPYGHVLLGLGSIGFLHVNALYDRPQFISIENFNRYLLQDQRQVIGIQHVYIPDMQAARNRLLELNQKPWLWRMFWDNCANFADVVFKAGGASYAEIDTQHIGNYHNNSQYPTERVHHASPVSLHYNLFYSLQTNISQPLIETTHVGPKNFDVEYFYANARKNGLPKNKAKAYANYRTVEGLSHSKAQYHADPSWAHYFVLQLAALSRTAMLPLFFLASTPLFMHVAWVKAKSLFCSSSSTLFRENDQNKSDSNDEIPSPRFE